jgi:hypothetical protein
MRTLPPFTSKQTLFWHGIYLAIVALVLFAFPYLVRVSLPFPAELDWWNRVLALPLFNLGIFCIAAAQTASRLLVRISIAMRLWVAAVVAALIAARLAPAMVAVVGAIDLVSAALTAWAMAGEARTPAE